MNTQQKYLIKPEGASIVITSNYKWYMRLWLLITNPFRYLFAGKYIL